MVAVEKLDGLATRLEIRRRGLLRELDPVHSAIEQAKKAPPNWAPAQSWLEKLEKWHDELHEPIEQLPRLGSAVTTHS